MKLIDLAQEFSDLNIFNEHTRLAMIGRTKIFVERSGVSLVSEVNLQAVTAFKKATLEHSAPITYNGYIRYLRVLFDYALKLGLVERNWFREIRLAPEGVPPPKTMDSKTIKSICDHILHHTESFSPDFFWLAVVYCFFYTGMRRRQLITLRVGDIHFDDKMIILSYEGSKTKRSWLIPMHDDLGDRLHDLILRTEVVMGRRLTAEDYLFVASRFNRRYVSDSRGRMKGESITGFFKRLSKSMGQKVGAHRFRHTFASELCNPSDNSSPDIFAVQAMLGHTNLQTTKGYVRTSMARLESTLSKISMPKSGC